MQAVVITDPLRLFGPVIHDGAPSTVSHTIINKLAQVKRVSPRGCIG